MSLLRSGVDLYTLYTIVKRIATPFTEWKAYKLGVIDDKGSFLIAKKDRTPEQYNSLTYLDIFVRNLKRGLSKVPGGNNKFVTVAAAMWLLKEDRYNSFDMINEDGDAIPANASSGELARSDQKEATAFKKKSIDILKRRLKNPN